MIKNILERYNIDTSHFKYIKRTKLYRDIVFIENSKVSQRTLRDWYLKEEIDYVCTICGQEPYWNGKEMTLILDHINGVNNDDRLENLRWVCPNCNIQLDTTNGKNIKRKEPHLNYCIECGTPISKKSTRCHKCNSKLKCIPVEEMPISRDELKNLIRNKSFLQIGKEFGVSDNAIRKWCKKFNLPFKSRKIHIYTNEEWELI